MNCFIYHSCSTVTVELKSAPGKWLLHGILSSLNIKKGNEPIKIWSMNITSNQYQILENANQQVNTGFAAHQQRQK